MDAIYIKLVTNVSLRWIRLSSMHLKSISSVQSLDLLGHQGDMTDDSEEILFQSFLQEAFVSNSCLSRDVHSFILSIQHFFCWPRHHPPFKVPWRVVLEKLSWHVTYLNHVHFHLLTVARRGSCGPTRKLWEGRMCLLESNWVSWSMW